MKIQKTVQVKLLCGLVNQNLFFKKNHCTNIVWGKGKQDQPGCTSLVLHTDSFANRCLKFVAFTVTRGQFRRTATATVLVHTA